MSPIYLREQNIVKKNVTLIRVPVDFQREVSTIDSIKN